MQRTNRMINIKQSQSLINSIRIKSYNYKIQKPSQIVHEIMTRIFADLQRNDEAIYMNDIIIYAQTK